MRKKLSIILFILIISIFTVACSNKKEKDNSNVLVTLVLDKGGVNDESFNQLAWEGAKKASIEYGIKKCSNGNRQRRTI